MRAMLRMSTLSVGLDTEIAARVEQLFDTLGFPQLTPEMLEPKTLNLLRADKKKSGDLQRLILLSAIGEPRVVECDWNETFRQFGALRSHPLMEA